MCRLPLKLQHTENHMLHAATCFTSTSTAGAKVEPGSGLAVVLVPAHTEGQSDLSWKAHRRVADGVPGQHDVDGGTVFLVLHEPDSSSSRTASQQALGACNKGTHTRPAVLATWL